VLFANPVMTFGVALAGITCFKSKPKTELAAIDTAGTKTTPSTDTVAVDVDADAFDITMFVITDVVLVFGTVYSVVLDVAAAVLARTFVVTVAIINYLLFRILFYYNT
jgi:hypothetical protein